ncbi:MAG: flagellar FliJ family protein [Synergistaceae bacterium]|jgi:flagellar export protein FliJ|nr:flagellar FliJ family protein [Synergistaceae bacterium]
MAAESSRFRRILHVRAVERDITQGELAGRLKEEWTIQERISAIRKKREDALVDFCSGSDGIVSPQQLWFERQNIDRIERNLRDGAQELEECRVKIEETKAELVERHQNVQLMERYVERLKEREDKVSLDLEQKNLDDITSMRFNRREGIS